MLDTCLFASFGNKMEAEVSIARGNNKSKRFCHTEIFRQKYCHSGIVALVRAPYACP